MINRFLELKNVDTDGERMILRPLKASDITQRYIDWLNDFEINRFLDLKELPQDNDTVNKYVRSYEGTSDKLLLGIFDKLKNLHIGNITFSLLDWENNVGVIGIAIGDKAYWGKGYATEALQTAINFAFSRLKLRKLVAGVSVDNVVSQVLFRKVGFMQGGTLEEKEKFDINDDGLMFELINQGGNV